MEESVVVNKGETMIDLPPGFRFYPTDEEIIAHYLVPKAADGRFTASAIGEVSLNKCEPWDMPKRAKMGEKEWYFFCQRDMKYPTGTRTNRATESGYWKATGKDKEIYRGKDRGQGKLMGMKKTLVFYLGRAPKGEKTGWVMHEFRLEGKLYNNLHRSSKDDWVVCRVFDKSTGTKKSPIITGGGSTGRSNSSVGDDLVGYCSPSPPSLIDPASSGFLDAAIEDHEFKFKEADDNAMNMAPSSLSPAVPKSADGSYFYFPSRWSSSQLQSSYYSNMMLKNPIISSSASSMNPSFSNQPPERITNSLQHCKADQRFSSNHDPMISHSQETGLSTDVNNTAEISSSWQAQAAANGTNNLEDIGDIECLWNF
ncbi:hypothetical protein SAY86_011941 [Trapa natans]|uniref:NAC domain-containing protein n=1 Tax=Trapa natans TaxID=22666 RepID=A0AAN7LWH1_TRANT|nr:hypothetical protein SAY86_011941 [Trapa natans]